MVTITPAPDPLQDGDHLRGAGRPSDRLHVPHTSPTGEGQVVGEYPQMF